MKKTLLTAYLAAIATTGLLHSQIVTDSLNFTGAMQTFTVPCGVTAVAIECYGAAGGSGALGASPSLGGIGGNGAYSSGVLAVTPGQVLNVFVGGSGGTPTAGFNGGAAGGTQNAGGGGGASDVRVNGTASTDRVITAGGGGGGGRGGCEVGAVNGGDGGHGGGVAGANGTTSPDGGGGFGGTISGGGGAGIGCSGFLGQAGSAGTAVGDGGIGGGGQACCCFSVGSIPGGGGGGGGFVGGGGGGGGSAGTTGCSGNNKGGGGGGAGGSCDVSGVSSGTSVNGVRTGNGVVKFTYTLPTPGLLAVTGTNVICEFTNTTLTSTTDPNANTYTWTVPAGLTLNSGQNTNIINITGATPGTYTISVVGTNTVCAFTGPSTDYVVTVNASPVIAASASSAEICNGDSDTLTASGAITYMWSSGGTAAMEIVAPSGNTTYTVVGMDVNGCMDTTIVSVVVNALPIVTATGGTICTGDSIALTVTGASTYAWSTGGTGSSETVAPTDTTSYSVMGVDTNGCASANTDTVTVIVNSLPVLTVSNDTTICNGGSVTMTVTGAATYSWSSGGTGASETVSPSSTATYTVTGTSLESCSSMATITVNVNSNPSVAFSLPGGTICAADANFTLTGGSPAGGAYSGTAVTGGSFSPTTAGAGSFGITYMYSDSNGCSSSAMDTLVVSPCVGISEANNVYGLTLMPNPASDNLTVTWDPNKAAVTTLEVYDNAGRLVITSNVNGGNSADLNVRPLPAGNYSLIVSTIDSKGTYQFIKQ